MSTNTDNAHAPQAGCDGPDSDRAWALYVHERHILQDDDVPSSAANYWHKLDAETQNRYLQRIRDSRHNANPNRNTQSNEPHDHHPATYTNTSAQPNATL